jgi:ABC-2 type transport system permease protein
MAVEKRSGSIKAMLARLLSGRRSLPLAIAVFAALVGLATLLDGPTWKVDLSKEKLFTLGDTTLGIIDGIKSEMSILLFLSKWSNDPVLIQILEKYAARVPKLTFQRIDLERSPGLASKYTASGTDLENGSIVVTMGDRFKTIPAEDIYEINMKNPEKPFLTAIRAESMVTAAIAYLSSGESITIYSILGNGETSLSSGEVSAATRSRNWDFADLDLPSAQAIPKDAKAVIVLLPKTDLSVPDAEKIRTYLEGGGGAAIILKPKTESQPTPAMDDLLSSYGVAARDDVVVESDPERSSSQKPLWIVPIGSVHEIHAPFGEREPLILLPGARSIERLELRNRELEIRSLLGSSPNSWTKSGYRPGGSLVRTKNDAVGPFAMAAAINEPDAGEGKKGARLIVAGSDFLEPSIVANFPDNIEFFVNALEWLVREKSSIVIPAKSVRKPALEIDSGHAIPFALLEAVLMPLLVLGAGLLVWLRRRHL